MAMNQIPGQNIYISGFVSYQSALNSFDYMRYYLSAVQLGGPIIQKESLFTPPFIPTDQYLPHNIASFVSRTRKA